MLQTINIPAGGRIVNAKASFFRYESASAGGADESLRVRADGNDLGTYLPGDAITLPIDAKNWELTPVTPTATATVRLGIAGVQSARLTGVVSVVDAGKQRTIAGQAFMGRATMGAGAGTFAAVQLFNPTGSGVRAVVEAVSMQCSLAGTLYACLVNVSKTAVVLGKSKLGGGADSVSIMQTATGATFASLDLLGKEMLQLVNTANVALQWTFKEPVVLPPGWGLMVLSDQSASPTVAALWEFVEEPNT